MGTVNSALARGFAVVLRHDGEPFTVDGCGLSFAGHIQGGTNGNDLGVGGFEPEASIDLHIAADTLSSAGIDIRPGLRMRARDRSWVVESYRASGPTYVIRLKQAHPKLSDIP